MQLTTHNNKTVQRILFALLLYVAMFYASTLKAAIVQDATAMGTTNTATSLSYSHTVGSGSNTAIFVTVLISGGNISNVQYNGSNMTLWASQSQGGMTGALYYTVSPTTGTRTISITTSSSTNIRAGSVSYFGVNQGVPLGDLMQTSGATANPSPTYNSDPGTALVFFGSAANPTPVTGTQVYERGSSVFNNVATQGTLGTTSLTYSVAASNWIMIASIMNPSVALPVTFGDLKANKLDQDIALNWNMFDLKDVQTIAVERSLDGHHFIKVADIEMPGVPSTVDFSFYDQNAPKQRLYYRIAITDKYGKTEYSPVTSINNAGGSNSVTIYPNPGTSLLNIRSGAVIKRVVIMSLSTQTIIEYKNAEFTIPAIDISGLSKGFYFLTIEDAEGNISREKFQKI